MTFPVTYAAVSPKCSLGDTVSTEWGGISEKRDLELTELGSSILVITGHHSNLDPPRLILTHFKCPLGQMCVVCGNHTFQAAFALALCELLTPILYQPVFHTVHATETLITYSEGEAGKHRRMGIYHSFYIGTISWQPPGKFNRILACHGNHYFPE